MSGLAATCRVGNDLLEQHAQIGWLYEGWSVYSPLVVGGRVERERWKTGQGCLFCRGETDKP
jgi:hypothetical protein